MARKSEAVEKPAEVVRASAATTPRLKKRYREEIVPALNEEFKYANVMQIPGLTKIVVNMGVGEAAHDSKILDGAIRDLTAITGQKPQVTKARKSIAQFKLREGQADRLPRHAARRPHVGVRRPAADHSRCRGSATSVG